MSMLPEFVAKRGLLRFMVPMPHQQVTAFISQSTWWAHYGSGDCDANLLERYLENKSDIDSIVIRKINAGSLQPVVLMASDL